MDKQALKLWNLVVLLHLYLVPIIINQYIYEQGPRRHFEIEGQKFFFFLREGETKKINFFTIFWELFFLNPDGDVKIGEAKCVSGV